MSKINVLKELNEVEKEAYFELKKRVSHKLTDDLENDDYVYIRFLRARDFNIDAAEKMLLSHLTWRRIAKIDKILSDFVPDEIAVKHIPTARIGFDKEGAPVRFFDFGNMDTKGLLKCVKRDMVIKTLVTTFEDDVAVMKEQSQKFGRPIEQWTYIMDYEDYSFAKATHKPTLECLIEIFMVYEANYPERLKACYVINAPVYFSILFNCIKPFLSGATMRKIIVLGKDVWKEELVNVIDLEVLPAFLGGKRTDPDGNTMCHTIVKRGHSVPEDLYKTKSDRNLKNLPGVKKITVSRKSKVPFKLQVQEPGSAIEWEFETECRDIGFGLFYQEFGNNPCPVTELIPKQRIDTNLTSETGMYRCERPGIYILMFDNSYSWIFQKQIYFKVEVVVPSTR